MREMEIGAEGINLTQILKLALLAESGGQAKQLIADGLVKVNGVVETRKRRQLTAGDVVSVEGQGSIRLREARQRSSETGREGASP
jgi:ribosome-associated protein